MSERHPDFAYGWDDEPPEPPPVRWCMCGHQLSSHHFAGEVCARSGCRCAGFETYRAYARRIVDAAAASQREGTS